MIVLDANVLIAYLDRDDGHHATAERLLAREVDDDFGANTLTLGEVMVGPAREGRLERVRAALEGLEVEELPFPGGSAVTLAGLRATTGLKMPDCCVLLAADQVGGRVASFDERLEQAASVRGVDVISS